MKPWFQIDNVQDVPSPQMVVYPERVASNISRAIEMVGDVKRLRPHIKTNKTAEVVRMMINAGIKKFKFATAEEGEMLGEEKAEDALMAYQPVGPRVSQLAELILKYPGTKYSCLVDHPSVAEQLSAEFERLGIKLDVFIDLNVGMNRTGISAGSFDLYTLCYTLPGLHVRGLHAYDGHIRDADFSARKQHCDEAFNIVELLVKRILNAGLDEPLIISGGSPSFSVHSKRPGVECSPGTFVFWDKGYGDICAEQPFEPAALVICRVISIPSAGRICLDLGHKAIAAENDISRRAYFLNAPDLKLVSQSEEHGIAEVPSGYDFKPGDVLYVLPYHICPSVNMYQHMVTVTDHKAKDSWLIKAKH
ncbi:MAG TPA: D-TA family PLP-dependent enzyme [Chitinophagaceae bacterium]|nr:D-TA family PLP-dependent enzyme [Chitinophagaceae bacterium]